MFQIFLVLLFIFLLYALLPNIYARCLSPQVIRTLNSKEKTIAFTFDDGPSSKHTPELLDLLREMNIHVTFFMVAERLQNNPEIAIAAHNDGHEIGLHSLAHRSAWLSTPWQTARDFNRSMEIFSAHGLKPFFFRPPWGTFNLFTLSQARRHNLQTVFWSVEAADWSPKATINSIQQALQQRIKPGAIIDLHDCGGAPGAPAKTLAALRIIIPQLKEQGYRFINLREATEVKISANNTNLAI